MNVEREILREGGTTARTRSPPAKRRGWKRGKNPFPPLRERLRSLREKRTQRGRNGVEYFGSIWKVGGEKNIITSLQKKWGTVCAHKLRGKREEGGSMFRKEEGERTKDKGEKKKKRIISSSVREGKKNGMTSLRPEGGEKGKK